ncbi:unnamed protein product [Polarella glacialis]|nr:unnamed protein product [Polarella glacialis]CAE8712036.1 unnamed protein product [Polarella glacialis]
MNLDARSPMLRAPVASPISATSGQQAPAQQAMSMELQQVLSMSAQQVGQYFEEHGFFECGALFVEHSISGERLLRLQADDLREMGFNKVGDRLGIQQEIETLQSLCRKERQALVLVEFDEVYPHNQCHWMFHTCCGACPPQLDHYKLTSTQLKITHTHSPTVCGRKCSCLGSRVENDYHPLSAIVDVDTTNVQNSACGVAMTLVTCGLRAGAQGDGLGERQQAPKLTMALARSAGEAFARQLREQIEEYKRAESCR